MWVPRIKNWTMKEERHTTHDQHESTRRSIWTRSVFASIPSRSAVLFVDTYRGNCYLTESKFSTIFRRFAMIFGQTSIETFPAILTAKFTGKEMLFEGFDQTFSCNHASRSSLGDGSWPVLQVSLKWEILCRECTEALKSSIYSKPLSRFWTYKRYILALNRMLVRKIFLRSSVILGRQVKKKIVLFLYANEIVIYTLKNL